LAAVDKIHHSGGLEQTSVADNHYIIIVRQYSLNT